ncbi:hypothetical protein [Paeniglutamicibacter sp. Y32M11]|uniref:hypothetical protein n=1 Tax=Paeniglutamicibacter sp. Y32M11 TaxID=2853258 RepID=UPI001C527D51|nr:hypothetical protein [Paeniglutamicibacter sp. Y32M11]QXQ11308.1 hypothetical protein KUF55_05245 [Paeniglutamicibacter sp. Y32M11]
MDPVNEWDWADVLSLVVTFLTGVGVFAIVWQIIGERSARHREFENMYVQRYWDIAGRLPVRFVQGHEKYSMGKSERIAMREYLILCEDELDLRKEGYITDRTWEIWKSGIIGTIHDPKVKTVINEFPSTRLVNIRDLMNISNGNSDPLNRTKIRRWWNGLR